MSPRTLFEKIWASHVVQPRPEGIDLLYIDRHYCHEGSFHAFNALAAEGRPVRRPDLTFGVADHYAQTRPGPVAGRAVPPDPEMGRLIEVFDRNMAAHGIAAAGLGDPRQGIVHVVGPEQGLTLPGMTVVCGDSHTSTHGALGAIAFGIGASEVAHVLATQCLWQSRPAQMRVRFDGRTGPGVVAKDMALAMIATVGANGAQGHAIEYAGAAVEALSVEGRLTLCNMSIEAGARCGLVAPDDTTFTWLSGRPGAPAGAAWKEAVKGWRSLRSDPGAHFAREVALDAGALEPMLTWGTSPEQAAPVSGAAADPAALSDAERRHAAAQALDYMGLAPGARLEGLPVDRVFIGSCTNARLDDLRAAAAILRGRRTRVPGLVSPGSTQIKREAEAEGLHRLFIEAGFDWRESGCSMCVGMNGDLVAAGERCASTSNRNFPGRQGRGARTHLMSPAMAAAAALAGRIVDVREYAA